MNDRSNNEDDLALPPDLAELAAELSSLRYEERPSFGPELEAELAREWSTARTRRGVSLRSLAAAAAIVLLMILAGVPQARASLVRFVTRLEIDRPAPSQASPSPPSVRPEPPAGTDSATAGAADPIPSLPAADASTGRARIVTPFRSPKAVYPEIVDRPGTESLIRSYYPLDLQKAGVGGTVTLLLWVDSTGTVDVTDLRASSGVTELDQAALRVAPRVRFEPARRLGKPVGTWVQFNVQFRANPPEADSASLPEVAPLPAPGAPDTAAPDLTPEWENPLVLSSPGKAEAGDLLRAAIGDERVLERLGPIEGILEGEPPAGAAPTQWRAEAGKALEHAMARDPDNPAVLLALGRLLRKQGLRDEARGLFERGVRRATREGATTSAGLLAALQYERGSLYEESWLSSRDASVVPATALQPEACAQVRSDPAEGRFASAEELVAWNYMCPERLDEVWETSFRPVDRSGKSDLDGMMTAFRAAVSAEPTHVGANVGLLLALADQGRWEEMLAGARRFAWVTHGHPDGFLLSGLALERLGLPEEAEAQFDSAFKRVPAGEVEELEDIRAVASPAQASAYANLRRADRGAWLDSFWAPLDPVLSTPVNEWRVEHVARTVYAHFRFGSASSDAGTVWVRYGRPDHIRAIASGPDVRTEFWDYGEGPDITFRGVAASSNLNLTSEGRSYLRDLRKVLPHRYGRDGRIAEALPGQVSRFQGPTEGTTNIEIDTRIPSAFRGVATDSLDLHVYQLGADGEKLSVTTRRVSRGAGTVSIYSFAPPDVRQVAVEALDSTGHVASMRAEAHFGPRTGSYGWASDLLLTTAEVPSRWEKDRNPLWLHPLALTEPVRSGEIGVYFQVYDLPSSVAWYQLRSEVENRITGEISGVRFHPADKTDFRSTWDRRSSERGPSSNFLVADLGDVLPGPYTLRVLVDVPGAPSPLMLERDLDIRR